MVPGDFCSFLLALACGVLARSRKSTTRHGAAPHGSHARRQEAIDVRLHSAGEGPLAGTV